MARQAVHSLLFFLTLVAIFVFSISSVAAPKYYGSLLADLPPDWACQLEGEDHVCLSNIEGEKKSSAIVITVRAKGAEDSISFFREQLRRPKNIEFQGLPILSQVKEVRDLNINGQTWIEGIHFGSELQGYFTHYLVTTDNVNSALVSINVHQEEYNRVIPTLSSFVSSLRLVQNTNIAPDVASAMPAQNTVTLVKKNTLSVMGYTIKKTHAILGAGLILVLLMLGYVIFMD